MQLTQEQKDAGWKPASLLLEMVGCQILYHNADDEPHLTLEAHLLSLVEGWPHLRFSDDAPGRPSQAVVRPSRIIAYKEQPDGR